MADASSMDVPDELVGQLMAIIPSLTIDQCKELLVKNDFDVQSATEDFFNEPDAEAAAPAAPANYTGPRTLDGRPAPQTSSASSSRAAAKKPQKKTGLATLSSIGSSAAAEPEDDESDEDYDDQRGPRDTYAGGEKSGLAVQDPNQRNASDPQRLINDILAKARSNTRRPEASSPAGPSEPAAPSSFRGSGQTLGGEGVESRVIPDPQGASSASSSRPEPREVQERTLHLWRDGFSIDDGELRRFDDPANADALRMIREGRAPIHLMNVRFDEPLDVKLQQHEENWRPLPKIYRPFGGEGRRLGSPVVGEASAPAASSTSTTTARRPSSSSSAAPRSNVDESQPTIMIRIQMMDGTRLPARFNLTQTVGDIYDFITRSSPGLVGANWVLATTFPNKDHTDKSLVLGDTAEFKKGGTAMVKRL